MFIYRDIFAEDFLTKVGPNEYKMKISGWASGGFSAPSDADALAIFKNILEGDK
jgi:hypothetical protein